MANQDENYARINKEKKNQEEVTKIHSNTSKEKP